MKNVINVENANENNLKDITVSIPKGCICGICGVSGSGKSTFACKVIAKYAMNAFAISMPIKLRNKLFDRKVPDVKKIENLPPTILIDIKNANKSIRSTVATISGLMTILRNMFSLCAKKNNGLSTSKQKIFPRLFSYNIAESEGGGACPWCGGTGRMGGILSDSLICDENSSLLAGAISVVNERGIKYTKISELFMKAFCNEYNIDINKPIREYSKEEMELVLYGSDKEIKFIDRNGANGGKKELVFPGIIGALLDVYNRTKNASIGKYIKEDSCNRCGGTRYNQFALEYRIDGYSISDVLEMNISEARKIILQLSENYNKEMEGFSEEFSLIAHELEAVGVGYLGLNRPVSTLSGGELQRVKLAKQIAMKYEENCYVIDEPSTGLHDANIIDLMNSINRLKLNHNTILLIEHNPLILNACDYLIELGTSGGNEGGHIVAMGKPKEIIRKQTVTGMMLKRHSFECQNLSMHKQNLSMYKKSQIGIYNVSVNNLKNVNIELPLNSFVAVSGISGSGKSSAINALYDVVKTFLETGEKRNDLRIDGKIGGIISLNQNASVTNSRSSVGTLLGVLDRIRTIFSDLEKSKRRGYDVSSFSKNAKNGACTLCGGTGILVDEDNVEEICDECNGNGYRSEILEIKYKGYNIAEILTLTIDELINIFDDYEINKILIACQNIGLGYLALGRKSPSLSKGEYQRIRIVMEICKPTISNYIYILDEPSKGLHYADVKKIIKTIRNLVNSGNTVIAIEHNLDVIMSSDYVLEFGPESGSYGGQIVFNGLTNKLIEKNTHTSQAIKGLEVKRECDKLLHPREKIKVDNLQYQFQIDKKCINVLKGAIGSGKSLLLKQLLYANPLKRYIASVSTQGKYFTREIVAQKNQGDSLPLTRLICDNSSMFGKNERVSETLNISSIVEKLFYDYGPHAKNVCKSSFNFGKKAGKCLACSGKGRTMSYDFEKIFSDKQSEQELYDLLKERTRIARISPLLKDKYKIDISRKYTDMSEGEKAIFLFGDKEKIVYYAPKKKNYYWEGCNAVLFSNMSYAKQNLQDKIKHTYLLRSCKFCDGLGVNTNVSETMYKGITYSEFNSINIEKLLLVMQKESSSIDEEKVLINILSKLIDFGVKDITLSDYTSELSVRERMIVQYISYRMNPLSETMIAWDDFGIINDPVARKKIIDDMVVAISENTIILLADNNFEEDGINEIFIGNKFDEVLIQKQEERNILYCENNELIKPENYESIIYSNYTVGNYLNITSLIRKEYKKIFKKYNFTGVRKEEKCDKCGGTGFYELNIGDLGISRCKCPDCEGTGFSEEINKCLIDGKSIGNILQCPLDNLLLWCKNMKFTNIISVLETYVRIGLGNISLNEKICELSSNEKILFEIVTILKQNKPEIYINDFSKLMSKKEYNNTLERINDIALDNKQKIVIIKER